MITRCFSRFLSRGLCCAALVSLGIFASGCEQHSEETARRLLHYKLAKEEKKKAEPAEQPTDQPPAAAVPLFPQPTPIQQGSR